MKKYTNKELGLESTVAERNDKQFAVSLKDTDTDKIIPYIKIFKEESEAIEYAKKLVL